MKFAFAGTPDFAAWVQAHLEEIGRRPSLVISQPDRPQGRGRRLCSPSAAMAARRSGIPCVQVDDIDTADVADAIRQSGAKVLVVAAFGQLLKPHLLDEFLCLNVHASLLPAYRGAAPIERALAAGQRTMGISIMRMAEGLDEGPWAVQTSISVGLRDDAVSVGRALALLGATGVDQVMTGVDDGNVVWIPQAGHSTYAAKLSPREASLDVSGNALVAHNKVRAFAGGLGARADATGLSFKVWRSWPYGIDEAPEIPEAAAAVNGSPGAVVADRGRLFVGCGQGVLELLSVQPVGKNRMPAADFLRGYASKLGDRLSGGTATGLNPTKV